ncbi:unnamed protein product [Cylindrotheca closterium]|uniref:Fe-S metabolism associated domain-containing protein n=1 Tax=Cylindrotheca closterium TaxID=2856 RepID=A0AAD2JKR6_9STRA|nr:unnamed protein product [Cylindrotheca closterium]
MIFRQALSILLLATSTTAFTTPSITTEQRLTTKMFSTEKEIDLGLTPELEKVTKAFKTIGDEQTRYKQLLYMAQNTAEANNMPESSKIPENKVPGCLSTVFIDGTAEYNEEVGDYVLNFIGDSDGLLTRGLVALLVRCLSGNTAEAIQKVDPQFIKEAQIEQSLTPGRNNGFLNMVRVIKQKATELDAAAREGKSETATQTKSDNAEESSEDATADNGHGPKYNAIVAALQLLKPTTLNLIDNSDQHAGHAGNDIDGESHFNLEIVAEAFEGLNLVKRHQLVYMMLGEIMPQIHALQIQANTPEEAGKK